MHSGYFRDIPLIEVSVEGGSLIKHCRKKRRPITFTVNAQENEGGRKNPDQNTPTAHRRQTTFFYIYTYITHSTNPNPPSETPSITRAYICSGHVTSSANIHTYRLDVMHAGDTNPTTSTQNPSVSQRTRTCTCT